MVQNNPNVAMIVWADAEKFALWEPVLPGMSRKYFEELPQRTLFARVAILGIVMLSEKSPSSHVYNVR